MLPAEIAPPAKPASTKTVAFLALFTIAATAAIMAPILYLNGPTDDGIRCERGASGAACAVLRSYFPGIGRRSFTVAESDIAGAAAECSARGVTFGHAAPSCRVLLRYKSGGSYPILSFDYAQPGVGRRAVARLNGYFSDPSQKSVEVRDDLAALLALKLGAPLFVVALAFLIAKRLRAPRTK